MKNSVAERILLARKKMKLTQAGLGRLAAVTKQAVSSWERGFSRPERDALIALEKSAGINKDYILSGQGELFIYPPGESSDGFVSEKEAADLYEPKPTSTATWIGRIWDDLPLSARHCIWVVCKSFLGEPIERRARTTYVTDDRRATSQY